MVCSTIKYGLSKIGQNIGMGTVIWMWKNACTVHHGLPSFLKSSVGVVVVVSIVICV